ncbi:hypothetical protein CRENBAI_002257 [Crenichthys baileyi]|uniref:Uncharacterized protein n=1 Tax=Crenichthys baileyi TaxID=28760 RepID=A0AAV9REG3_9TELE
MDPSCSSAKLDYDSDASSLYLSVCLALWLLSSLSKLWASGKCIKNSYTSPAKRRQGRPASSPVPSAPIFVPQTDPPAPQRSTSSLTHLFCEFAAISATPALPLPHSIEAACSWAPPTGVRPR